MAKSKSFEECIKAEDLFSGLNPENNNLNEHDFKIKRNKGLERILNGFRIFLKIRNNFSIELLPKINDNPKKFYALSKAIIPKKYTSTDITSFSIILSKSEYFSSISSRDFVGLYLSSLCNNCPEDDIKLFLNVAFNSVGFRNTKNLYVKGNAGSEFASEMKKGKIIIDGNADAFFCEKLKGGEVILNGCVSDIGYKMSGGRITINGDCSYTCREMYGGEVYIYSNKKPLIYSTCKGGNIYFNDKCIVKNGKMVGATND